MKATIESTWRIMDVQDARKRPSQVRVFEGTTDGGIGFVAYVVDVQILPGFEHRRDEFDNEVASHRVTSDTALRAIARARR